MRTGKIDKGLISEIREQCYAEAVHRFKASESWWVMPKDETELAQEMRRDSDEWESTIREFLSTQNETEIRFVAKDCFSIPIGSLQRKDAYRIGKCLRAIGWECHTVATKDGVSKIFRRKQS